MSVDPPIFRVDLRLLLELGERLISRDEVAVVELVKNAYDADAKTVNVKIDDKKIVISDTGKGMGKEEILEGWLTIGTTLKKMATRTELGRRVLGEKGIGRLAVLRLGKIITIRTLKKNGSQLELIMDWEKARNELQSNAYSPLSQMKAEMKEIPNKNPELFPDKQGTVIIIEKLNAVWDGPKINRLKVFLSRLVEPSLDERLPEEKRFGINFYLNDELTIIEPPQITKNPHYSLDVKVTEEGGVLGKMVFNLGIGKKGKEEPIKDRFITKLKIKGQSGEEGTLKYSEHGIGPFKFVLAVWDLDLASMREYKNTLRQWSGISLYRDGFRVVQPDVDWLGLGLRRVQNPTLRLSTNQIIGSVFISSDTNPNLIDKTDREGLIDNESFWILKGTIEYLMDIIELKRYSMRRTETLAHSRIFSYLDTTPLKQLAKTLSTDQKKELRGYANRLDKFKSMLGDWMLGRDRMATIGILGSKLLHTSRSALAKINDNYPLIEKYENNFEEPLRKRLHRMVEGGRMLNEIFVTLDPFLKYTSTKREEVNLKDIIDSLSFLFEPEFGNVGIKLNSKVSKSVTLTANPTDMYVIFANIFDNAIYWLKESENKEKTIDIRVIQDGNQITVEIADSGPGIPPENINSLFAPGFTTKPNGTGLGLSIVKDALDLYGGSIVASNDPILKGALFTITFPSKAS